MPKKAEKLNFGADVKQVLHLVIHSLYKNKDIFLRELISNASDACDKLRFEAIGKPELLGGDSEFKIKVSYDQAAKSITVQDNGIGMNHDDLVSNLGTIAKSGTKEFLANLGDKKPSEMDLIGQFGVGFYSAFMVANKVTVETMKAGDKEGWLWESEGEGEFEIKPGTSAVRGTKITLFLRGAEEEYLDKFKLEHIIKTYSDHIPYPIELSDDEGNSRVANAASALWTRQKSEITEEQYNEFFKHVAHIPGEPWMVMHNHNEGKIEYTNLLYVPSTKPFDLLHPDRMRRVKLYVKKVFITEDDVDLIPHWLRFLRGVVDSADLPLNVSRETLQQNAVIEKIKANIVKRFLGDLKKKAEKDAEGYAKFWANFGAVMKEGLCEWIENKTELLEVCRFHSSSQGEKQIGLDDYISRMKEGQENIFYLNADSREEALKSPQIEAFLKNGVEVLLFTDTVDNFWVNVVHDFKGKKLASITRSDVDAGAFAKEESCNESAAKQSEKIAEDVSGLVKIMKEVLGDTVKDVRAGTKLVESPVSLAVDESGMDIRLERFLLEQRQLQVASAKILEINPRHPVISSLAEKALKDGVSTEVKDTIFMLLDQAKIVAGEGVLDIREFTRRMNDFLGKGMKQAA